LSVARLGEKQRKPLWWLDSIQSYKSPSKLICQHSKLGQKRRRTLQRLHFLVNKKRKTSSDRQEIIHSLFCSDLLFSQIRNDSIHQVWITECTSIFSRRYEYLTTSHVLESVASCCLCESCVPMSHITRIQYVSLLWRVLRRRGRGKGEAEVGDSG